VHLKGTIPSEKKTQHKVFQKKIKTLKITDTIEEKYTIFHSKEESKQTFSNCNVSNWKKK